MYLEKYSSWWRGAPAKGVGRIKPGARVRVSPSPPEKSTHLSTKTMCAFFNEINPLRDLWNALRAWNTLRVWNALRRVRGFISFHIATKEQYFTIHEVNYFTFGVSRIFHLKHYRFYDIINSSINKNLQERINIAPLVDLKERENSDELYKK